MTNQAFRILSVDGGGVRGFLAAAILANIEDYLNNATNEELPLGLRFDFIAGTSAGGLIALALAQGRKASEVRDLFLRLVPKVFGKENRRGRMASVFSPKYRSGALQSELESFFKKETLGDLKVDACITSVALMDAKPRLHKTDYLKRNAGRLSETLVDVAMATTAAPTYFAAHSSKHGANLVDGGLAANNPSMIAYVDAMQFERPSKRNTPPPAASGTSSALMLSVGTGQPGPLPYNHQRLTKGGWGQWAAPIHEVVLLSQAQLIHHQAKFLLKERYLRIDPVLNVRVTLDDAEHFSELRNKADVDQTTESFLKAHFGKP